MCPVEHTEHAELAVFSSRRQVHLLHFPINRTTFLHCSYFASIPGSTASWISESKLGPAARCHQWPERKRVLPIHHVHSKRKMLSAIIRQGSLTFHHLEAVILCCRQHHSIAFREKINLLLSAWRWGKHIDLMRSHSLHNSEQQKLRLCDP